MVKATETPMATMTAKRAIPSKAGRWSKPAKKKDAKEEDRSKEPMEGEEDGQIAAKEEADNMDVDSTPENNDANDELNTKIHLNLEELAKVEFGKDVNIPDDPVHDDTSEAQKLENKKTETKVRSKEEMSKRRQRAPKFKTYQKVKAKGKGKGSTKGKDTMEEGHSEKEDGSGSASQSSASRSASPRRSRKVVEDVMYLRAHLSQAKYTQAVKFFQDALYQINNHQVRNSDLVQWGNYLADLGRQKAMPF